MGLKGERKFWEVERQPVDQSVWQVESSGDWELLATMDCQKNRRPDTDPRAVRVMRIRLVLMRGSVLEVSEVCFC